MYVQNIRIGKQEAEMQVCYMISRCDNLFSVAKTSTIAFSSSVGVLSAFPYKELTVSALIIVFFMFLMRFNKVYKAYQNELHRLPKSSQERVNSAIHKHHHDQIWWRWPITASIFFLIGFFAIKTLSVTILLF